MRTRSKFKYVIVGAAVALLSTFAHGQSAQQQCKAPAYETLDLRAPSIYALLTEEEISRVLWNARDGGLEGIEVRGARVRAFASTPEVWPAIAAPVWALLHPAEAWRIFLPLPPDRAIQAQTRDENFRREPVAGHPLMAGEQRLYTDQF